VVGVATLPAVVDGVVDFADDEQPATSAIATPAPATAIPFNTERRLIADSSATDSESASCMETV
jgi:hypothetical protein